MNIWSQPEYYHEKIKSVFYEKEGVKLASPIINVKGNDNLNLRFDYLSDLPEEFSYKIQHLTADYKISDAPYNEYAQGFEVNKIRNRKSSTNSLFSYFHYWLSLPNEDIDFLSSGNYLITIFPSNDTSKIMMKRVFYVYEESSNISASIMQPPGSELTNIYQHLDMTITPHKQYSSNVEEFIKVCVMQNMRYDNMMQFPKPTKTYGNSLIYDDMDFYNFEGGSEYRHFEMKSLRYESPGIEHTEYISPYYHIFLKGEKVRTHAKYQFDQDINGRFFIQRDKSYDVNTEADYLYVHFKLEIDKPILDGNIYIIGALSNQLINNDSKLTYNFEHNFYEKKILLKQGYYNYLYIFRGIEAETPTGYIEGNHFATENEYCIFVYFCPLGRGLNKLIGLQYINSNVNRK